MLGVPLSILQLAPAAQRHSNEQLATLLCISPDTGFAPVRVSSCGLGPVLVARVDGRDSTTEEMEALHRYNVHLMDVWPEECSSGPAWRRQHLSGAALQGFVACLA